MCMNECLRLTIREMRCIGIENNRSDDSARETTFCLLHQHTHTFKKLMHSLSSFGKLSIRFYSGL